MKKISCSDRLGGREARKSVAPASESVNEPTRDACLHKSSPPKLGGVAARPRKSGEATFESADGVVPKPHPSRCGLRNHPAALRASPLLTQEGSFIPIIRLCNSFHRFSRPGLYGPPALV
jgi:hypothetical protein